MASRTSAGVGVGIAITLFILLSVALFVTTMLFYGRSQRAEQELDNAEQSMSEFVTASERESERVRSWLERARGERETVVGHLIGSQRQSMQLAAGIPDLTADELEARFEQVRAAGASSLLDLINAQREEIAQLTTALEAAEGARLAAQTDAQTEAGRVAAIESSFGDTISALNTDISTYRDAINEYRSRVDGLESKMDDQVQAVQDESNSRIRELQSRLADLNEQNLVLQDQVRRLRGQSGAGGLRPQDEFALVDAEIVQIDAVNNEVVIGIGREDKVPLGMTFAVYSTPAAILPDRETGEYARGKAVIEVISVNEDSSRARIIREARGNPIVRGDVIANAVYDPDKVYAFLVYGNFDTNLDGVPTPLERDDLSALIARWGGKVVDDIDGGLDFLVLGEKPTIPPLPGPQAPIEILNEYVRLNRVAERYDELFEVARQTSIPVLNENRLRTLIGDYPD